MNRVNDCYEVAKKFLALPPMARYVICMHFGVLGYSEFNENEDIANITIFTYGVERDFQALKRMVEENDSP